MKWGSLISSNNDLIKSHIYIKTYDYYEEQNNDVYYLYRYLRNNTDTDTDISPSQFVTKFEKKYYDIDAKRKQININTQFPPHIHKIINQMETEITKLPKRKGRKLLEKYDEKDYFTTEINNLLKKCLENYFEIESDEASDNDSDDSDDSESDN